MSWKRFRPWFRKTKERLSWPGRMRPALLGALAAVLILQGCVTFSKPALKSGESGGQATTQKSTNADASAKRNESVSQGETAPGSSGSEQTVSGPVDPLRGVPSTTQLGRPILFMIENAPKARPQTGLELADVIYEILAEGEITRFAAIYHSKQPKTIGPVRSIRPYYVELGAAMNAVIVHAGWSQDAAIAMKKLKVDHFDQVYGDEAYYWRDKSRKMPHNLYSGVDRILQGMAAKKKKTDWTPIGWTFMSSAEVLSAGESARTITIPYPYNYTVRYEWNDTHKRFSRLMNGKSHKDRETANELKAANVLIVKAKHKVLDKALRRNVDVKGPGKGWLAQSGRIIEVSWKLEKGLIRAFDSSGNEYPMVPGQTWIQVVPMDTKVSWKS